MIKSELAWSVSGNGSSEWKLRERNYQSQWKVEQQGGGGLPVTGGVQTEGAGSLVENVVEGN